MLDSQVLPEKYGEDRS